MALPRVDRTEVIAAACEAIRTGNLDEAAAIIQRDYPFTPRSMVVRKFHYTRYTRVFVRDGFIDRYSGEKLLFPPVLRVLSHVLPDAFPYHKNWKADSSHRAYWDLGATVDHLVPVARGGTNDESNLVTTSMARNAAKMHWTLEELGWELQPSGDINDWDGMLRWFIEYTAKNPEALLDGGMRGWRSAAVNVTSAPAK